MWLLFSVALAAPCASVVDGAYKPSVPVAFVPSSEELTDEGRAALAEVACAMAAEPGFSVHIGVHTDSRGSSTYNLVMSQKRADVAKAVLVELGATPDQVTARGYGEDYPLDTNASSAGRGQNRRVELLTTDPGRPERVVEPPPPAEPRPAPPPSALQRFCAKIAGASLESGASVETRLAPAAAAAELRGCLGWEADQDGQEHYLTRGTSWVVVKPHGSGSVVTFSVK